MASDSLSLQGLITRGKAPFSRALQSSRTIRSISTGAKVALAVTLNWNAQFNWQRRSFGQNVPARTRADHAPATTAVSTGSNLQVDGRGSNAHLYRTGNPCMISRP